MKKAREREKKIRQLSEINDNIIYISYLKKEEGVCRDSEAKVFW